MRGLAIHRQVYLKESDLLDNGGMPFTLDIQRVHDGNIKPSQLIYGRLEVDKFGQIAEKLSDITRHFGFELAASFLHDQTMKKKLRLYTNNFCTFNLQDVESSTKIRRKKN